MRRKRHARQNWRSLLAVLLTLAMAAGALPTGLMGTMQAEADVAGHVVISEIYPNSSGSAETSEFVELYNPTGQPVDIGGYTYGRTVSSNGNDHPDGTIPAGTSIAAHGYYLIGDADPLADGGGSWAAPDLVDTLTITNSNGSYWIKDSSGNFADRVAWGTSGYGEGAPYSQNPPAGRSLERKANNGSDPTGPSGEGNGNGWDTDDNAADFVVRSTPKPQNSGSSHEPASGGGGGDGQVAGDPEISAWSPTGTVADATPEITATFTWGVGAGSGSVSLELDDSVVATIYGGSGPYTMYYVPADDLSNGEHDVSFTVVNDQDKQSSKDWTFTISDVDNQFNKIAVFSDPHYYAPELGTKGQAFEEYLNNDRKLIAESSAIVRQTVDELKAGDAGIVLVTGDLTKDGELVNHQQFAAVLGELEAVGKEVFVVAGNHDINNPHAFSYAGDQTTPVDNVTPEQFKQIYHDLGFGEAIAQDPNSLSYVVEPVEGLRIIAMDSVLYDTNLADGRSKTEGAFSEDRLNWIKQQINDAVSQGKTVYGMMHHGLVDHFTLQRQFFPEYVINDADRIASELAGAGMKAVFTGHFHAQDIVKKQTANGPIYDIETGSLVTSPCPYRIVELTAEGLNISTSRIESIDYDLGGQEFPAYARDYLVEGLNGLVPRVVAGLLIQLGVPADQALAQAEAKLSTPVAAGLTVKDLVVNAMAGHYQGDETIDPQLLPVIQAMAGSADPLTNMMGQALLSLGTDPAPADNNVTISFDEGDGSWDLTVMHTNDTHAHLDDDKALIAKRAAAVGQIRAEAPNNLLLDAGDVFSGTLFFTQYEGQADLEFMNTLGYDAMGLGNHEFDKGPQGLAKFLTAGYAAGYNTPPAFPVVNSNFDFSAEPSLSGLAQTAVGEETAGLLGGSIYPAVILDVNGEKVGLIGLTTEDADEISSPGDQIQINDAFTSAAAAVAMLENKDINKIIAISHLGWDKDLTLAQQVEGIDVIVGGHSHTTPAEYPTLVTDSQYQTPTLVVQASEYGKYLGRLDVSFDGAGLVTDGSGELLDVDTYAADPTVEERLNIYRAPLEELKNIVVGSTLAPLDGERNNVRAKETNLANLIADGMLEKGAQAGAVMAITNGGGIRASIDQGDITLGEVLTVMPFGNTMVVLELTGQQIVDGLENGVSQVESLAGRFPQVAGLKFTWDPQQPVGSRIVKVEVKTAGDYQPIELSAKYLVATNSFMATGGDGYTSFAAAGRIYDMGFVDYEVFKEYLQNHSPVNPQVEGRITEGAPVPSEAVIAARDALAEKLGSGRYTHASVAAAQLVIDAVDAAIADGSSSAREAELLETMSNADANLVLINQAVISVAPNTLLGENRSITFRISVDSLQDVDVMEGFVKIADSKFEITDIVSLYASENFLFTKNLNYSGDGTTAYFSLAQIGGFADTAKFDAVDVTLRLKDGETAPSLEAALDSIKMYLGDPVTHTSAEVYSAIVRDGKAATNILVPSSVTGDFNGDDKADGRDLSIALTYFGAKIADADWYTSGAWRVDFNNDEKIDIADLMTSAYLAANLPPG